MDRKVESPKALEWPRNVPVENAMPDHSPNGSPFLKTPQLKMLSRDVDPASSGEVGQAGDPQAKPDLPRNVAHGDPPAASKSYRNLARRITAWTSNFLAMAVVLVLALGAGHYALDWSRREPPAVSGISHHDGQGPPQTVEFAAAGVRRAPFSGPREAVRLHLQRLVQDAAVKMARDQDQLRQIVGRPPLPPESKLLELTAARSALTIESDRFEVHEFVGIFPLMVSFVHLPDEISVAVDPADPAAELQRRRLSAWAMAVPAGGDQYWSVYLQTKWEHPTFRQDMLAESGAPPLPTEVLPTLRLQTERGGYVLGFSGEMQGNACRQHFDRWASHLSPPQTLQWTQSGHAWHAQIPQRSPRKNSIHIQFATDARGRLTGLVTVLPPES